MDNAFPVKKAKHHLCLQLNYACILGEAFYHPLERLHFGFNIIAVNSHLIYSNDVHKKLFIFICSGKQFLTDFGMLPFLIVSQQTWHEFCSDAVYLKFFSHNFMARSYAVATSLATSQTL